MDVIVTPSYIQLGEELCAQKFINKFWNKRDWHHILPSNVIKWAVVLNWTEFAIFLIYKKERAGVQGFGLTERTLCKAIGDVFFKGNFLGWYEMQYFLHQFL